MEVKSIEPRETYDFILKKHYAQRKPSISYAFGLFISGQLEGILTVGKPASNSLCEGVCGVEFKSKVYELNRLCVNEGLPTNTLSRFVSTVMKMLKNEDLILVSYADTAMCHVGYIYQATNWLYTGETKSRTDKYVASGKHSRHYGVENNHLRVVRSPKHRYVYFATNKRNRKIYESNLKYNIIVEYPKLDPNRYSFGDKIMRTIINTTTNTVYYD